LRERRQVSSLPRALTPAAQVITFFDRISL
jgi:hypothetical protein